MKYSLREDRIPEKEMVPVVQALLELAHDNKVRTELPHIDRAIKTFMEAMGKGDALKVEAAITGLYTLLHAAGSSYSSSERERLTLEGGYSCIAGGLSPLLTAGRFIGPGTIVADLGAGNGLQGLLLERLYPHKNTLQIELSSEMIRMGRVFQKALCIGDDSMEWINGDIADVSLSEVDFVYLYRPARPSGKGERLYRTIAQKLKAVQKPVVVLSVADCLSGFLDKSFSVIHADGHLTCFRRE